MAHLLLVEDNPIDARLMARVLGGHVTPEPNITWIDDGQKALWYLESLDAGRVDDRPSIVLLDLNLPKYDGLQVLAAFRKSITAWNLPIFLLSSTPAEEVADLADRRKVRADGYIQKPYGLPEMEEFARFIGELVKANSSASRTAAA